MHASLEEWTTSVAAFLDSMREDQTPPQKIISMNVYFGCFLFVPTVFW